MRMAIALGSLSAGRVRGPCTLQATGGFTRAALVGPAPRTLLGSAHLLKGNRHLVQAVQSAEPELEGNAADSQPDVGGAAQMESGKRSPADLDREKFQLHWSVDLWRAFNPRTWLNEVSDGSGGDRSAADRLSAVADTLNKAVSSSQPFSSTQSAQYWAYHLGRTGFFVVQAVLGLVVAQRAASRAAGSKSVDGFLLGSNLRESLTSGWVGPLTEALLMYYQDYENIKEGRYKLPWDMTTPRHRQFNPLFVLRRGSQFLQEGAAVLSRRQAQKAEPVWLKSGLLPRYYQNTWHYQTDGWLSQQSAQVYESSTETLFVGRQDAMQRSTLVPLSDFMKGRQPSQVKVLEVACGTGRFGTFVKDNWPTLDLTLSDLSPFYLAEARSNMKYWKQMRAPQLSLGGVDGHGTTFLQAEAENLPAPDASFDVVYSVYLLHEMPPRLRTKAIQEMARVLKPGGMLILTDSYQRGDRTAFDNTIDLFGDFNEPNYRNYVDADLGAVAEEAGLVCGMKVVGSSTKALSFTKPMTEAVKAEDVEQAAPAPAPTTEIKASDSSTAPVDPLMN